VSVNDEIREASSDILNYAHTDIHIEKILIVEEGSRIHLVNATLADFSFPKTF